MYWTNEIWSQHFPNSHVWFVRLRLTRSAIAGSLTRACSQNLKTIHPLACNWCETLRSRDLFRRFFSIQYFTFCLGVFFVQRGQKCQKHPSTKIATFSFGKAKSGLPGRSKCFRHPEIWCFRNIFANRSSVVTLPAPRIAAIFFDLCGVVANLNGMWRN